MFQRDVFHDIAVGVVWLAVMFIVVGFWVQAVSQ